MYLLFRNYDKQPILENGETLERYLEFHDGYICSDLSMEEATMLSDSMINTVGPVKSTLIVSYKDSSNKELAECYLYNGDTKTNLFSN